MASWSSFDEFVSIIDLYMPARGDSRLRGL